jgi:hypothetical protein
MGSKLHLFRSQIIKKSGLKFVFIRVYARTDIYADNETNIKHYETKHENSHSHTRE